MQYLGGVSRLEFFQLQKEHGSAQFSMLEIVMEGTFLLAIASFSSLSIARCRDTDLTTRMILFFNITHMDTNYPNAVKGR